MPAEADCDGGHGRTLRRLVPALGLATGQSVQPIPPGRRDAAVARR